MNTHAHAHTHTHTQTHTHNIKWNWFWAFANCGSSRKQLNPWLPAPSPPWGILTLASQAEPEFGGNFGRTAAMEAPTVLASFLLWLVRSARQPCVWGSSLQTGQAPFSVSQCPWRQRGEPQRVSTHVSLCDPWPSASAFQGLSLETTSMLPTPETCWTRNLMFLRCDEVWPPQLWRNKHQQLKCSQLNKAEHSQWVPVNVLSGDRELGHHTEERSHSLGDPQCHPQGSLSARVEKGQHKHFSPRARVLSAIRAVSLLYATLYYIYVYIYIYIYIYICCCYC